MIYTDGLHVISDTSMDELHAFAKKARLRRDWFQAIYRHPHYDAMTAPKKKNVLEAGATVVSPKEIVKILKRKPYTLEEYVSIFTEANTELIEGDCCSPDIETLDFSDEDLVSFIRWLGDKIYESSNRQQGSEALV